MDQRPWMTMVAMSVALAACSAAGAAERSFAVGSFDSVDVAGAQTVVVSTGKPVSVRAEGAAADLERLEIGVAGGRLTIGTKSRWAVGSSNGGPVRVSVTVPMLRDIGVEGSGSITIDDIRVPSFSADVAGSGTARVVLLATENASFATAGSGSIEAAGTCTAAKAATAGSGAIRIASLKCATLNAETAGSGNIDAFATQSADISIMGSGNVRVTGGARCNSSTMGSGKAICR